MVNYTFLWKEYLRLCHFFLNQPHVLIESINESINSLIRIGYHFYYKENKFESYLLFDPPIHFADTHECLSGFCHGIRTVPISLM